jgi:hypothetical protein
MIIKHRYYVVQQLIEAKWVDCSQAVCTRAMGRTLVGNYRNNKLKKFRLIRRTAIRLTVDKIVK